MLIVIRHERDSRISSKESRNRMSKAFVHTMGNLKSVLTCFKSHVQYQACPYESEPIQDDRQDWPFIPNITPVKKAWEP